MRLCHFFILGLLSLPTASFAEDPYAVPRSSNTGSRGIQAIDRSNGAAIRLGTRCELKLYGEDTYSGICNVGRRGRVTLIDTGTKTYKIVRDEFETDSGTFYSGGQEIGSVTATGSCWRGKDIRFCAN